VTLGPSDKEVVTADHCDVVSVSIQIKHLLGPGKELRNSVNIVLKNYCLINYSKSPIQARSDSWVTPEIDGRVVAINTARPINGF
jgi:hypothetical protein